ncbi:MAG: hypothetical protein QF785_11525 [Phycisphaeraceae bacterium]|jgi:regulator of RNase E activity RraA|nr:hypothetical protein [Phycisphaeraceae bacterium]MDP7347233.1 hypothetical protein [Phycisphaeraceae bacterium]
MKRPPRQIIDALSELDVDPITTMMDWMGVRRTFIEGPVCRVPGSKIVGPALTLRFVPQREDKMQGFVPPPPEPSESAESDQGDASGSGEEEEAEKRSALWEIMNHVQPGDVIVVDGRGDHATGCFGEMLCTYFKAQGGAGIVTDACIRDSRNIFEQLKLPVWSGGVTTGGASHKNLWPIDFNLPIGCGNVLVEPGDIIMADDGGAIVVPPSLAPSLIKHAGEKQTREIFIRMKLREGGAIKKYYPLNEQGQKEYEQWLARRADG